MLPNKFRLKFKKIDYIFASFVFILLTPRFIAFATKSDYFNGDFAFYYFLTKDILINRKLPLLGHVVGELGGFAQGPLFSYLLTIPFFIFDGDPFGGKMFMLINSLLIFLVGSFFAFRYIGRLEGFLIAFFLGTSPYLIKWTNLAWPPYIVPLITISFFIFLYLFLSKKQNKYLYLTSLSLGLMSHFEIASLGLLFPSFILILIFLRYQKLVNLKTAVKSLILLLVPFIPHLIYDLTNNFYNLKGFLSILIGSSNTETVPLLLIVADRIHLIKTDLTAVFPIFDYRILILIFLFLLTGFYFYLKDKKIKKWNKIFTSYLLVIIASTFIGLCLIPVERASFWWITYLTITYIFFAGIILSYMLRKNVLLKIIVLLILFFVFTNFTKNLSDLNNRRVELKNLKDEIKIQEPVEFIYKDSNEKEFNVIFLTTGEKVTDYKYMFWVLEKNRFNNSKYPSNLSLNYTLGGGMPIFIKEHEQFKKLKPGIYYIIISNRSLKSGYAKRILEKNNFGKIIYTKTVNEGSDGFTIQKRTLTK